MMHLTLDTISLLGMSLVIGILVDDSTVVLENIERHFTELKQPPEEAAIAGREEIGAAAVVITLVDVVVFLPIAFIQGQVGPADRRVRHRRRHLDAHLALRLLYDYADAGRFVGAALALEAVGRRRVRSAKVRRSAQLVRASRAAVGLAPRPPGRGLLRRYLRARDRAGRRRRGRRRVHSAGRSRRDLHSARLSDRHADRRRSKRAPLGSRQGSSTARIPLRTPPWPAPMRRRSAGSSRRATSARCTSGSKTSASTPRITGSRSSAPSRASICRRTSTPSSFRRRQPGRQRAADRLLVTDVDRRRSDAVRPEGRLALLQESPGRDQRQQLGYAARARDIDPVRSQQGAGARRQPAATRRSRRRRVRRRRRDAVRDAGGLGAGAGHLSARYSDEPRCAQVRSPIRSPNGGDRPPWRLRDVSNRRRPRR